eukprot:gene21850-26300_t
MIVDATDSGDAFGELPGTSLAPAARGAAAAFEPGELPPAPPLTIPTNQVDTTLKSVQLHPDFTLEWALVSEDIMLFRILTPVAGWVSIGFDPSDGGMDDCDMIMAWTGDDGQAEVTDCWSSGYGNPDPDVDVKGTEDIMGIMGTQVNGVYNYTMFRHLDTRDKRDARIEDRTQTLVFAWGTSAEWGYHGNRYGVAKMGQTLSGVFKSLRGVRVFRMVRIVRSMARLKTYYQHLERRARAMKLKLNRSQELEGTMKSAMDGTLEDMRDEDGDDVEKTIVFPYHEFVRLVTEEDSKITIIRGRIVDLGELLGNHPGGDKMLLDIVGRDGSAEYEAHHGGDTTVYQQMKQLVVGAVASEDHDLLTRDGSSAQSKQKDGEKRLNTWQGQTLQWMESIEANYLVLAVVVLSVMITVAAFVSRSENPAYSVLDSTASAFFFVEVMSRFSLYYWVHREIRSLLADRVNCLDLGLVMIDTIMIMVDILVTNLPLAMGVILGMNMRMKSLRVAHRVVGYMLMGVALYQVLTAVALGRSGSSTTAQRPYTPYKPVDQGVVSFMIKRYEGGEFTPFLFNLEPDSMIDIR